MGIYTVKATITFPSSTTFQITTPYRQKTFTAVGGMCVDLEKLVELKKNGASSFKPSDFYLMVYDGATGSAKDRFNYEAVALTSAKHRDVVAVFDHHIITKIEVKIKN